MSRFGVLAHVVSLAAAPFRVQVTCTVLTSVAGRHSPSRAQTSVDPLPPQSESAWQPKLSPPPPPPTPVPHPGSYPPVPGSVCVKQPPRRARTSGHSRALKWFIGRRLDWRRSTEAGHLHTQCRGRRDT